MNRIMLIEDNPQIVNYISEYLLEQEYTVKSINNFDYVMEELLDFRPDLILLDINLPKFDGFFFLKKIKKQFSCPVIIISARSDESEQVRGLENGANDYITKPFSINILLAKIANHLNQNNKLDELTYQGLVVDKNLFRLTYLDKSCELTKNELVIITTLITAHGDFVSRDLLLEALWDDINFIEDNTLTVNITRVRKKLATIGLEAALINKRGVGYALSIA